MNLILLHGLGQTSAAWTDTIKEMEHPSNILSPNLFELLGDQEVCYPNLYEAFSDYCRTIPKPFRLCGLSLGGMIALQYAVEHPDHVDSMVLIGTQVVMPKRLIGFQNLVFRVMPNRMFQQIDLSKYEIIHLTKSMMCLDFQDSLKVIQCPVLVVCGEKDKANMQASLQLQSQIPHSDLVIIEHAGHEVNVDQPQRLGKLLHTFMKQS